MLLLQKISLFNLGVHISPQFCGISNFSCNCLILPNFSGSYVQCFLITDANLSDIASPRFWEIWCSWSTWQGLGRIMTTRNFCRSVGTTIIVCDGSFLANYYSIIIFCTIFQQCRQVIGVGISCFAFFCFGLFSQNLHNKSPYLLNTLVDLHFCLSTWSFEI